MKKVKITKEQYDKLIKSGVISESNDFVGKVDKTFKNAFNGKDVYNLKYIPEERIDKRGKFNIKKPLSGIRNITEEVNNLLEYIYGLNENFSAFWENYDLTYEDLCEALESKGYLIRKEGAYKVSKKMGDVKSVKEGISQTLTEMLTPIEEDYPAGAEFDSTAPYNRPEPKRVRGEKPRKRFVELKYSNPEIAIFSDLNSGEMYVFYYGDIDYSLLEPYADRYGYTDADGDLEYDENFEIDDDILENYVNDNFPNLTKGVGVDDFESGKTDLVLINEELKDELLHLYDKDSRIVMVLEPISESTGASSSGSYVGLFSPSNKPVKQYDSKKLPPVVTEMDSFDVGNIGYDNPAFLGISKDGKFPTNPKPTKAQKNTQWADGAFVKFDDCTKLNNNKEAQNGKCSTGAADGVVKLVKTKDNVNAPSLSESKKITIYKLDRLVKKNKI
jgi:hypothetical protein